MPHFHDVVITSDSLVPYEHSNKVNYGDIMQHKYFELDDQPKSCPSMTKFDFVQTPKLHDRGIKRTPTRSERKKSIYRRQCS